MSVASLTMFASHKNAYVGFRPDPKRDTLKSIKINMIANRRCHFKVQMSEMKLKPSKHAKGILCTELFHGFRDNMKKFTHQNDHAYEISLITQHPGNPS